MNKFLMAAMLLVAIVCAIVAFQTGATRFSLPDGQQFTNAGRQLLSISADGNQIVYVANNRLYVKAMSERGPHVIEGTDSGSAISNPVFSPDGKFIAFWMSADQTLKRIAVSGGTPQTICPAANPFGMSWSTDGDIAFGQGADGIRRVRAAGGASETIVTVKAGQMAHGPVILPGGNAVLYTLASISNAASTGYIWDNAKIVVQSLKSNESKTLLEGGSDARYSPTGHIVYATAGKLMSVPFDLSRTEVTGKPVELVNGVRNAGSTTGTTQFSFSSNGSLIYIPAVVAATSTQRQLAFVDFNGNVKPIRGVPATTFGPRISPNGKQVAYRDDGAVWIVDLTSDAIPRRLTTEPGEGPIWSPDGERIAYISIYKGLEALYWRRSDGTGSAELLADRARAPESWSAVNQEFSFITLVGPSGDAGDYDIWTYSTMTKKATPLIVIPPSAQSGSRFSPDGKWLAYESNETGRAEIYVEPLPRTGQRFRITTNGGSRPLWAPDSSKLYFDNNSGNPTRMFSVNVRWQPSFTWTDPEPMPIIGFVQPSGTYRRQFDITPDGKQFLMMFSLSPGAAAASQERNPNQIISVPLPLHP